MGLTVHYKLAFDGSFEMAKTLLEQLRQRALDLPFQEVSELSVREGDECDFQKLDKDDPARWAMIQAQEYVDYTRKVTADDARQWPYPHIGDTQNCSIGVTPEKVIYFSTWPGYGSEEANFGLSLLPSRIEYRPGKFKRVSKRGFKWNSFCKTQYASNPEVGGVQNFLRCHISLIRLLDEGAKLGIVTSVHDEGDYYENRDPQKLAQEVGEWNEMIAGMNSAFSQIFNGHALGVVSPISEYPNVQALEEAYKGRISDTDQDKFLKMLDSIPRVVPAE